MDNPKFSIIIMNYNYGRFLRQCIDSCLEQSFPPHEIIVIDDGSTDDSREILKEYQNQPLVRVICQENAGQPAALQRGFDAASGDWMVGVDSDDYLFPSCLEEVARRTGEDLCWIYFRAEFVDEKGVSRGRFWPVQEKKLLEGNLAEEWLGKSAAFTFPPQSFSCYSAAFVRSISVFPNPHVDLKRCLPPDFYMRIEAVFFGKVGAVDRVLGAYRDHAGGDSKQNRKVFEGMKKVFLACDLRKALIAERLEQHGYAPAPMPFYHQFDTYWEMRLLSLSLDPAGHPHPEDTRLRVFLRAASLLWANSELNFEFKLIKIGKDFLMLFFPSSAWTIYQGRPRNALRNFFKRLWGRGPA